MKDYIINSFILQEINTLLDIYNYIKNHYEITVDINDIKIELTNLIKNKIIIFNNKKYELSNEGNIILEDHKYYYSKIIIKFYKTTIKGIECHKKYELREIRKEQQLLRNYLITYKKHICIICEKKLPLCLLETAHLKPRCILNNYEINDKNIVEFMCRYCHNLYDNGLLSVYNGLLQVSTLINNYDLQYEQNKHICIYNLQNAKYFIFHYKYIYII
jgi:hypothetical protein